MNDQTTLAEIIRNYANVSETNDKTHADFAEATWRCEWLARHRKHVEDGKLGFGDPAFHYMWFRILEHLFERFGKVNALEIGVFKGQVISAWALIAKQLKSDLTIHAITPLEGDAPAPIFLRLASTFSRRMRERLRNGDYYAKDDYLSEIRKLFDSFSLDFDSVVLHRGLSTNPDILNAVKQTEFSLIYVDGDHTFDGALFDFEHYGPLVCKGGFLVADDASCFIPGTKFWKGHEAVSRAAARIEGLGFRNVLNVGHNRVFEKL